MVTPDCNMDQEVKVMSASDEKEWGTAEKRRLQVHRPESGKCLMCFCAYRRRFI